jgi:hypothetical protein
MIDQATFYRELMGPVLAPATTPSPAATISTANSSITGCVVRESAHDGHHPNRRRVVFLRVGPGNGRHGNNYTEQALRVLVSEIQRRPKIYLGHASEAAIHAGTERHLGDMAGVAVRETVHYDAQLKACVGDIECAPAALQVIDLAHAAGDTVGVSIEAVGEPARYGSHDIVDWRSYRGACLVPEGGAGGMTVREAATPAAYDDGYSYGGTTMSNSTDFLRDLLAPIAATAAVREAAVGADSEDEGAAIIREAHSSLIKRHPRLNGTMADFVIDRAVAAFVEDPYTDETFEAVVTRESDAYAETLPPPLGREGSIQFFDALIEARGGR